MRLKLACAAMLAVMLSGSASAQDAEAGAKAFKKCLPCHAVGEQARNKVGPLLNGLDGRRTGTIAQYSYSEANKNSGIVWGEAEFLDYIRNPKAKIPNTKMMFAGVKDVEEAKNLWAYLKQFAPDGKMK